MVEKLTKAQAGSIGGKNTWATIKKEERRKRMKKLAEARWAKTK